MKTILFLLAAAILFTSSPAMAEENPPAEQSTPHDLAPSADFCGSSTNGPCKDDSDCMQGGCSGQVCQSRQEPPAVTTCEWRDCYKPETYGMTCGCAQGQCQWFKKSGE